MKSTPFSTAAVSPYFEKLKAILNKMDAAYDQTAGQYGFHCTGCMDNCCHTHFFHHTYLEYGYLWKGLHQLSEKQIKTILEKAGEAREQSTEALRQGQTVRVLCPLNAEGICQVYPFRPIICRMHGIPHHLILPGNRKSMGPGCALFHQQCGHQQYIPFDRTPFYREIAQLENQLKNEQGLPPKFKRTIYQMITDRHEIDRNFRTEA